jgi:uncharacterized protein YdeI (YjbR/CyaY-like superfamily)
MVKTPSNAIHPMTRTEWRNWLEQNHTRTEGVWLISYKKATGKPRFDYEEAVEEALCFGWIDSKSNKLDNERSMRCLPRANPARVGPDPIRSEPMFYLYPHT